MNRPLQANRVESRLRDGSLFTGLDMAAAIDGPSSRVRGVIGRLRLTGHVERIGIEDGYGITGCDEPVWSATPSSSASRRTGAST
jgi:hypothetical protein